MLPYRIRAPKLRGLAAVSALLAVWLSSCAPSGFQDEAQLQGGVRILASSANPPYARPGEAVRIDVLAYDGRDAVDRSASPMQVYWFPVVCENPTLDEYYACFNQFAHPDGGALGQVVGADAATPSDADGEPDDGGDSDTADAIAIEASTADGGAAADASGPDTGVLDAGSGETSSDAGAMTASDGGADAASGIGSPVVSTFSFVVPPNAVSSHPVSQGATPYGLLVAFNFACAGQLTLLPLSGNPQAPPLGCADATGKLLGPDSYVFGYTRVYAYAPDAGTAGINTNPVIDCVDVEGASPHAGETPGEDGGSSACAGMVSLGGAAPSWSVPPVTIPACAPNQHNCPHIKIGPHVTSASWEPVANGLHEEIWADYYSTFGTFTHDSTLLYDPMAGLIGAPSATDTEFDPPAAPTSQDGYVWIVVHDNRGGAAWVTVPVHVGP
jgi:hypothetical protein